jgi:hypothetical protein
MGILVVVMVVVERGDRETSNGWTYGRSYIPSSYTYFDLSRGIQWAG